MIQISESSANKDYISEIIAALDSARDYLLRIRKPQGFWCGELEGDTILESEYILTMFFLGRGHETRVRKAAEYIRRKALPDGGWAIYPGGAPEVSASVKAYFVLKLLGEDPNSALMTKSRKVILELGGLNAVNSFTAIYLAIFGQMPWEKCPAVPPEIALLPDWLPINLYEMSSWSRCIIVPLSVIWAHKPSCEIPKEANIAELWTDAPPHSVSGNFWKTFFGLTDAALKFLDQREWTPLRSKALNNCEQWMLARFSKSDGLGAIFPPIVNSIIALHCFGYSQDDPVLRSQIRQLEKLEIEERSSLRISPCYSPVWDTALALTALAESDLPSNHDVFWNAADWLLSKEVRQAGDWKVKNPDGNPGGWYFEYANEFYPDVDDTFQVLIALSKVRFSDEKLESQKRAAIDRGVQWTLTMQNKDGGWGSFDRGVTRKFLTQIPFADHNAIIDPSTSDVTARGIECLMNLGFDRKHSAVKKAVRFLLAQQEPDGSWFGRWGCNYIYGTFLALRALRAAGVQKERCCKRAAEWLRSVQNSDGGWGESPRSYEDPSFKGKGPSTPSQTAWALLGLMACSDYESIQVTRGIEYLRYSQYSDGSWKDDFWTATGFPKVFYLRYHLYAIYFPLFALGVYKNYYQKGSFIE